MRRRRVGERHVLDDAVVVLEVTWSPRRSGCAIAIMIPATDVGQRLTGGEADDRGGDRAGGQQLRREPAHAVNCDSAMAIPIVRIDA